ncbi:hypothetical protein DRQ16_04905, partial [bacterium]
MKDKVKVDDVLEYIIRGLTDNPVDIKRTETETLIVYTIKPATIEDTGMLIGKKGRTITNIKSLIGSIARKQEGKKVEIELISPYKEVNMAEKEIRVELKDETEKEEKKIEVPAEITAFLEDMKKAGISTAEVEIERRSRKTKQWRKQKAEIIDIPSESWQDFLQRVLETRGSGEYRFTVIYRDKEGNIKKLERIPVVLDDPRYPYQPGYDEEDEGEEEVTAPPPSPPPSWGSSPLLPPSLFKSIEKEVEDKPELKMLLALIEQQQRMIHEIYTKMMEEKKEQTLQGTPGYPDMTALMNAVVNMVKSFSPAQKEDDSFEKALKIVELMSKLNPAQSTQNSLVTPDKMLEWTTKVMNVGMQLAQGRVPEIETESSTRGFR